MIIDGRQYTAENSPKISRGDIITYEYDGIIHDIYLPGGEYLFKVWGAQGGTSRWAATNGGQGGYAEGKLKFGGGKFYIRVGAFNKWVTKESDRKPLGGGAGLVFSYAGGDGGGHSSIHYLTNSNYSRIIVAGGGGGASYYRDYGTTQGLGGGVSGTQGKGYWDSPGGTQTAGGNNKYTPGGGFGYGGGWVTNQSHGNGGSGWYGGGSGYTNYGAGGGGSGFVWSEEWKSSTINVKNNAAFNLTDDILLTDPVLETGVRFGDGLIEIHVLSSPKFMFEYNHNACHKYNGEEWEEL